MEHQFNLIESFPFSRLVAPCECNVDVSIGDGAGAVSGVVSDVFPGTELFISRNAGMTQPVHRAIHHRFGFFFQLLRGQILDSAIKANPIVPLDQVPKHSLTLL